MLITREVGLNLFELIAVCLGSAVCIIAAALSCLIAVVQFPYAYYKGGRIECAILATKVADWYWGYLCRVVETWGRWNYVVSGDKIPLEEDAIIISNHRWIIDWLMIMTLAMRKGRLGGCKLFAKDSIRWIPGIGWGIWILDYIFLKRDWTKDSASIQRTFSNLKSRGLPFWLASHVEGTRLTPSKLKKSQDWAKKNNLPILNNVLLPRSKGFAATLEALGDGTAPVVYDLTIVYEDGRRSPTMASLALRRGGRCNVHVRRYLVKDIPKDPAAVEKWLLERWVEKDALIDYFLKHGNFPDVQHEPFVHLPIKIVRKHKKSQ